MTIPALPHCHLTTLTLAANLAAIGTTAAGHRGIAPVIGGRFEGERLSGIVLPGADWFLNRPDGALAIDVRLTLRTDDGVSIYLAYQGAMIAAPAVMARFRKGEQLAPEEYALRAVATFECGHERYRWLNDVLAVAIGEQTPTGPIYTIFEIVA